MSTNKTALILTGKHELIKQYFIYDSLGRCTHLYEAITDAAHGKPCLLTQYGYTGTDLKIVKKKESESSWDSSWDVP